MGLQVAHQMDLVWSYTVLGVLRTFLRFEIARIAPRIAMDDLSESPGLGEILVHPKPKRLKGVWKTILILTHVCDQEEPELDRILEPCLRLQLRKKLLQTLCLYLGVSCFGFPRGVPSGIPSKPQRRVIHENKKRTHPLAPFRQLSKLVRALLSHRSLLYANWPYTQGTDNMLISHDLENRP